MVPVRNIDVAVRLTKYRYKVVTTKHPLIDRLPITAQKYTTTTYHTNGKRRRAMKLTKRVVQLKSALNNDVTH